MFEVGQSDDQAVVVVGDISHGILKEFRDNFPSRYFNIGISEPGMVNVAAGLSAGGLIPIVHTIAPFLIERSYEQIKLDLSYQSLGANLISVGGAFDYSKLGCSHHCYTDYSLLSKFENCDIYFPGSNSEFDALFKSNYDNGRINYFRLTEYPHENVFTDSEIFSGKGIKIREGKDLTIVTFGALLGRAQQAEALLVEQGFSIELLYFHTLKPLDSELIIESVRKTQRLIVFEEIHGEDGIYSVINNLIGGQFAYQKSQIAISGFIRNYGTYSELSEAVGLTMENLVFQSLILLKK